MSSTNGGNSNNLSTEWAALKLMLKFLQRFMRYATNESDKATANRTTSPDNDRLGSPAQRFGSSSPPLDLFNPSSISDGLPHQHKNSLSLAHSRVLLAVCELIIYSPVVASYLLTMPGARAIIKASCLLHKNSTDIGQSVMQCLEVLQKESERVYEMVTSNRHSQSYELTHGRSSKLFNPVAVLARRDGPSPRVLSRPSTSSGSGILGIPGTTFGSPKILQSQPSFHRSLTSKYSSPRNPFTTEFSVPLQDGGHADVLVVHHEDEPDEDFKYHHPPGNQNQPEEETKLTLQINQSNKLSIPPPATAPAALSGSMIQKSFSADSQSKDNIAEQDVWISNCNPFQNVKASSMTVSPMVTTMNLYAQQSQFEAREQLLESAYRLKEFKRSSSPPPQSRPKAIYNPPESPPRRGLKEHQSNFIYLFFLSSRSWHKCVSSSRLVFLFAE
jgi:hypothetical protein